MNAWLVMRGRHIDNQLITALEKYNAYPIKWSEREFKENLYKLAS